MADWRTVPLRRGPVIKDVTATGDFFTTSFGRIFCSAKNRALRGQNHAVHGFVGAPQASMDGRIIEANAERLRVRPGLRSATGGCGSEARSRAPAPAAPWLRKQVSATPPIPCAVAPLRGERVLVLFHHLSSIYIISYSSFISHLFILPPSGIVPGQNRGQVRKGMKTR
jgi:hypothetical protein